MRSIKRYANRKLYDTETSRYITLDEVAELIRAGEELVILDNKTGKNITNETLRQIIARKGEMSELATSALRELIVRGKSSMRDAVQRSVSAGKGVVTHVEDSLGGLIKKLAERNIVTPEEARSLLLTVRERANKQADRLESLFEEQINASLSRLNIPNALEIAEIRNALDRLSKEIDARIMRRRTQARTGAAARRAREEENGN